MSGNAAHESASATTLGSLFEVAGWMVDPRALKITKGDETRHLEVKTMTLLVCLASRPQETMTRRELEDRIWPDMVVGYGSLTKAIIKLRRALGDASKPHRIIETIPKVGYRLIADVKPHARDGRSERAPAPVAPSDRDTAPSDTPPSERAIGRSARPLPIITAVLALLLSAGVLLAWQAWAPDVAPARQAKMAFSLPGKPSIAVLPFENHSVDPDQAYLSDAMVERIITELSRFPELFVIARNSSFKYQGQLVDVRRVSEELGVHYVLEGSLQREGDKLWVSVQLIDALAGNHVWAESYDRTVEDVFAIQDEITKTVVATVTHTVQVREWDRSARGHPGNLTAYEYYLRGDRIRFGWNKEANEQALTMFEKAVKLDPNLARGYVGLARVYLNGYRWGYLDLPRGEALRRALAAARTSVELDPFDYLTYRTLAYIQMRSGSLEEADEGFEKALKLNPNAERVLVGIAELRQYQGRYQESIDLMKQAMRLNPHHPDWYHWVLADTLSIMGRVKAALAEMNKMASMPNERAYRSLAAIYVGLGRMEKAREAMKNYLERDPGFTVKKYGEYLETLPYRDSWVRDNSIEALRKAGLPE